MTSMQVGIRLMQENSRDDIESALKRDLTTAVNMCVNDSGIAEFSAATKHKLLDKQKYHIHGNKEQSLLHSR